MCPPASLFLPTLKKVHGATADLFSFILFVKICDWEGTWYEKRSAVDFTALALRIVITAIMIGLLAVA
jgi:hypothetical protein